jgi:catechol 2,3-dioxygenase-like lactoylglutathione lyase family enzyme
MLHHVELWVPDLEGAVEPWGWLLGELGWVRFQDWPAGRSWRHGDVYVVLEQSPALTGDVHDRKAPGLNHLAFTAAGRPEVDRLTAEAPGHGWSLLFPDRHPHAGGPDSYAAYLEDNWGFEVEIQSEPPS